MEKKRGGGHGEDEDGKAHREGVEHHEMKLVKRQLPDPACSDRPYKD